LQAIDTRHQQRDAAIARHTYTFREAIEGFEFKAGEVKALELFGRIHGH